MMRRIASQLVLLVLLTCVAACSPSGPLTVTTIQVGRSLNDDNSVGTHTTRFKPADTVYVSVLTADTGAGTIVARWSYGGRVVGETKREVAYQGQAATQFPFQESGGLPEGEYKVEILVDGTSIGSRSFRVEK